MHDFKYSRAKSLVEATATLKSAEDGRYLAGGQTLLPVLKQRLAQPSALVDLAAVPGLSGIQVTAAGLTIGAMTRHADVAASADVGRMLPALAELAGLMTVTGIAMGVAGKTAPLSGMEHTVSHMLDMAATQAGRPLAFHGAQVGVAAAIGAIAWKWFLDRFDPTSLRSDMTYPEPSAMEARVLAAFERLDSTGAVGAECWADYARKLERWGGQRAQVEEFIRDWPEHRRQIESLIGAPASIAAALHRAGSPSRFRDLDPPADEVVARWAIENCHLMRNRFTVADLAFLTGNWSGSAVDEILAEATALGVGL